MSIIKKIYPFILLDIAIRIFLLINMDNSFLGDAGARLETSVALLNGFEFSPNLMWLPFPMWLDSLSILLTDDIIFWPRVTSAIFSTLTLIPLFIIALKLFGQRSAQLTLVLFSTSVAIGLTSTLTLSEPSYIFFSVSSLAILLTTDKSPKNIHYAILFCFIFLNCLTRFEAWGLSFFIFVTFIIRGDRKGALTCIFAVLISVGLWELTTYERTGRWFHAILDSNEEVIKIANFFKVSMDTIIKNGFVGFCHFSLFIGTPIAIYFLIKRKHIEYIIISMAMLTIVTWKFFSGSLNPEFRYQNLQMVLLLPFVGFGLLKAILILKIKDLFVRPILLIFLILSIGHSLRSFNQLFPFRYHLKLSDDFMRSANWAKNNMDANAELFVDKNSKYDQTLWLLYAGRNSYENKCIVESRPWLHKAFTKEYFRECLEKNRPINLVLFPYGVMNWTIKKDPDLLKGFKTSILYNNSLKIIKIH